MRLSNPIYGTVLIGLLTILVSSTIRGRTSANSGVHLNDEDYAMVSAYIANALTAKTGTQRPGTDELDWHKVDTGAFSVFAPLGWKFHQLQGVDSYVGEFVGDGVVLKFDFGRYSNPLKDEKKPAYVVVHKSIAGLRAKIVSPKTPGHGVTGIYFAKTFGPNKLCLFGQDLSATQQGLALKIFETIQFGRSVPPILPPPSQ